MPGETERRSVFRPPVYLPQPPWDLHPDPPVRRPGVLVGDQAIVQRAFQVVAVRRRSRAGVAGAPGAVAAGGGQPGDRSGTRVAEGELRQNPCVLIFLLACCGYAGNMALPRAGDLRRA